MLTAGTTESVLDHMKQAGLDKPEELDGFDEIS